MLTSQSTVSGGPQLPAASLRPSSDMVEAGARSGPSLQSTVSISISLLSTYHCTDHGRVEMYKLITSENVNLLLLTLFD